MPEAQLPRTPARGISVNKVGVHPRLRISGSARNALRAYNKSSVGDREVAVERERQEAIVRQEAMVDDLRKAELVRDRLESLQQSARAYPEGHYIRVLVEGLHLDEALRAVEEDIRTLRESLLYPRGT
jgi:hypothetical protein